MLRLLAFAVCVFGAALPAAAQELRALARLDAARSSVEDDGAGVRVALALTQAVPYRIFTLESPNRVVLDFREVSFETDVAKIDKAARVTELAAGRFRPGWSRLVLELSEPLRVASADLRTDPNEGTAMVAVRLEPVSQEEFATGAGAPQEEALPASKITSRIKSPDAPLVVALDPGHGGVDPGAQRDGHDEADLMLQFARELREAFLRSGVAEVVMTRRDDSFVSLPARVSIARAAGADVLLSLHADAIAEGRATGTTIYTLSEEASDAASAALAARQDRRDILAGVDLRAQDDQIATVLMELVRRETRPRTDALADALVVNLKERLGKLHKRPRLKAGFSVLKAPDMPSVLIELGFMSSETDLRNLTDPVWRSQAAEGVVDAVRSWSVEDAARRAQLRQ